MVTSFLLPAFFSLYHNGWSYRLSVAVAQQYDNISGSIAITLRRELLHRRLKNCALERFCVPISDRAVFTCNSCGVRGLHHATYIRWRCTLLHYDMHYTNKERLFILRLHCIFPVLNNNHQRKTFLRTNHTNLRPLHNQVQIFEGEKTKDL